MKGPGRKLTDALNSVLNGTTVIADDYGGKALIPGVKKLLAKTGWLDTKVLMFAFDGDPSNEHLPHNYPGSHTVVYAGTHDNDTIVGYFRDKTEYELAYLYEYLNISSQEEIPDALIRCAYASIADIAIIQMQDLLKVEAEHYVHMLLVIGVVLCVRADMVDICIVEVLSFSYAEYLVAFSCVEKLSLFIEELERIPMAWVMTGGGD